MAKGLTLEELKKMGAIPVASTRPTAQPKSGAVEDIREAGRGISTSLQKRGAQFGDVLGRASKGEINPLSAGLRFAGTAAGAVTDIAAETVMGAVKAVLPESAEKSIQGRLQQALQTDIGRAGVEAVLDLVEKYRGFEQKNPELGKDIRAVGNIASLLPIERAATGAAGAVAKAGEGVAKAGANVAEQAGKAATQVATGAKAAKDIVTTVPKSVATKASEFISTIPKRASVASEASKKEAAELALASPAVREASKMGIKPRHATLVEKADPAEKEIFKKMYEQARAYEVDRSVPSPSDIAGKEFQRRIAEADALRQTIGEELGNAVKGFVGKDAPARMSVLKRLQGVNGLKNLKIKNDGSLDFSKTTLASSLTKSDRSVINEAFSAIKGKDAEGYHMLRQEIFEALGGRKKASIALTDTQERALEAVRQGLADTLETISPRYRAINKRYAEVAEPLKALRKTFSGLEGASGDVLDEVSARLLRRLTSESMGGSKLKDAISKLDDALAKAGQKSDVNLQRLQDFSNALDEYFDIVKDTSFAGQVGLGTRGGARGVFELLLQEAGKMLQSSEIKKKALENLLFNP